VFLFGRNGQLLNNCLFGMTHSQEEILISPEKLDEIGLQLSKIEKELRDGLGLRASQRKTKEWKVANTIDLITVILDIWGCGTVENKSKQSRKNGKIIREYSLTINKCNTVWKNIICSNIDYNNNLLIL
jgi:hypothetical protein